MKYHLQCFFQYMTSLCLDLFSIFLPSLINVRCCAASFLELCRHQVFMPCTFGVELLLARRRKRVFFSVLYSSEGRDNVVGISSC